MGKHVSSGLYLLFLGYYCARGAVSAMPSDGETGNICPVGHYCPMGSSYPVICPDGTYTNTTGRENSFNISIIGIFNIKICPWFMSFVCQRKELGCVKTVPLAPTVCQEKVPSYVQQDITVLVVVLRGFCPVLLARTVLDSASAKWSSALFVQQVRVLSSSCLLLHCTGTLHLSLNIMSTEFIHHII